MQAVDKLNSCKTAIDHSLIQALLISQALDYLTDSGDISLQLKSLMDDVSNKKTCNCHIFHNCNPGCHEIQLQGKSQQLCELLTRFKDVSCSQYVMTQHCTPINMLNKIGPIGCLHVIYRVNDDTTPFPIILTRSVILQLSGAMQQQSVCIICMIYFFLYLS